jgi:hypothetical protein
VVAEKVKEKYHWAGNLKQEVKAKLLTLLIAKRLKEENRENLAALFLRNLCEGDDGKGNTVDFEDEQDREIFNAIFGPENITTFEEIPETPLSEKLVTFILATGMKSSDLPDIDDSEKEWGLTEQSMQWRFIQVTRDEYISMYRELLNAIVKKVVPRLEEPTAEEVEPQIEDGEEEAENAEADAGEE